MDIQMGKQEDLIEDVAVESELGYDFFINEEENLAQDSNKVGDNEFNYLNENK
jgi:hypothetical protein